MPVVVGEISRGFSGTTELTLCQKVYQLSKKAGGNLLRFGWTASLSPDGKIYPEKYGCFTIEVPDGVFFTYANQLRNIVNPQGMCDSASIYVASIIRRGGEMSGARCRKCDGF